MRRHFLLRLLHRHRPVAHVVADLVGREVALGEPRAGFEADDVDARLRERQHGDAAGGAEADDDDVGVFEPSRPWRCVTPPCVLARRDRGLGEHLVS